MFQDNNMDPYIAVPVFLICLFHGLAGKCTISNYIAEAFFVFPFTYMTALTAAHEWSPSILCIARDNPRITQLIQMEIGFYIGYVVVDFWRKEWEQCLHHAIAIVILYIGKISLYHQFALTVLFLFSLSNPFLTVSKIVYKLKLWKASKIAFSMFAVMFFTGRCVGAGWLLWISLLSIKIHNAFLYATANCLAIMLYSMQWMWMKRIIRILLKPN